MIQKKICMLGASAVGKTSLVRRFVQGVFSDKYLTTIGVKIDRKQVEVGGASVNLLLWDLNGEDRFQKLSMSYLRGASGYFLVADGTRRETLDTALSLHERVRATIGPAPCCLLINKADLELEWEVDEGALSGFAEGEIVTRRTSAKTGTGVEEAFRELTADLLQVNR